MRWLGLLVLVGCAKQATPEVAAAPPEAEPVAETEVAADCPGTLPPTFLTSFRESFLVSFERTFQAGMVQGLSSTMPPPEGWTDEGFQAFAGSWWEEALSPWMPDFAVAQQEAAVAAIAGDAEMCTLVTDLTNDPDVLLMMSPAESLSPEEGARRDAYMDRLATMQQQIGFTLAPLGMTASADFMARVGPDQLAQLGTDFTDALAAEDPR